MPTAVNLVVLVTEFGDARVARTIVFSTLMGFTSPQCYGLLVVNSHLRAERARNSSDWLTTRTGKGWFSRRRNAIATALGIISSE